MLRFLAPSSSCRVARAAAHRGISTTTGRASDLSFCPASPASDTSPGLTAAAVLAAVGCCVAGATPLSDRDGEPSLFRGRTSPRWTAPNQTSSVVGFLSRGTLAECAGASVDKENTSSPVPITVAASPAENRGGSTRMQRPACIQLCKQSRQPGLNKDFERSSNTR